MKKILVVILALSLVVALTACTVSPAASNAAPASSAAATSAAPSASASEVASASASASAAPSATATSLVNKQGKQIVIGWVCQAIAGNEMYTNVTKAMEAIAKQNGVKLISVDAQADESKQVQGMEDLIAQGVDAIMIDAINPTTLDSYVQKAQKAGIGIVAGGVELKHYDSWGCVDQTYSAQICGEQALKFINDKLGGKAKIGLLGSTTEANITQRQKEWESQFKDNPNIQIVIEEPALTKDDGMKQTENMMQAHPDIKVILAGADDSALGALEAIKGLNLASDDFGIFTINGSNEAIKQVAAGSVLRCTVRFELEKIPSDMMGAAMNLAQGKTVEKIMKVTPSPVTIDNAKQFLQQ